MTRRQFLRSSVLATGAGAALLGGAAPVRFGTQPVSLAGKNSRLPIDDLSALAHSHDLRLPDWGPFTTAYNGISHIADPRLGYRFDVSVFPGLFRRGVLVPNVAWEAGFHPWEAAPDLSYFSYRYEIEWKDQVYCDVSFSQLSPRSRLVAAEFVNRTALPQNLVLHLMASFNYPFVQPYSGDPLQRGVVRLPAGAVWMDALDYELLEHRQPRANDGLSPDGRRRGEIREHGFVNGSGIGGPMAEGDRLEYRFHTEQPFANAVLLARYRNRTKSAMEFGVSGLVEAQLALPPSEGLTTVALPVGRVDLGSMELRLVARGKGSVELDGFALVEAGAVAGVAFEVAPFRYVPEMDQTSPGTVMLKYPDAPLHYGIAWRYQPSQVRQFYTSELDRYFRRVVHDHVSTTFKGDDRGHFTNVFLRPIAIAPRSSKTIYAILACGTANEVKDELGRMDAVEEDLRRSCAAARRRAFRVSTQEDGEPYRFSQERMAATVLTNVIYPVYGKRRYFRHYAPGKWWDSLYTWDSGFTGIGLSELDVNRAIDCLNAYTTEPRDAEAAFIHHGTPIPVQLYLFLELWNRTQSRALLEYFYPRLRQYHLFLAGRINGSTTRGLKSGLLKTWDYFYNTGWDDYPPQMYIHQQKIVQRVGTSIINSHLIRTARLLARVARMLSLPQDIAMYEEDIAAWTRALQEHAWDHKAGYYSYVVHNADGEPTGILRHESGRNFNEGLDGVMPLLAGICDDTQIRALLDRMQSPKRLWTAIGLSTVDQSAPYYRTDGYWNGSVWMPHQWFLWKAMLDLGESDFAFKIAQTALEVWKREVDASYHCFEHFLVESGRGAGWHQFSALSSPVLSWFAAYYKPGRLTTGFDAWLSSCESGDENRTLRADLELTGGRKRDCTVLANLKRGLKYRATWKKSPAVLSVAASGTIQIKLPADSGRGELMIWPK